MIAFTSPRLRSTRRCVPSVVLVVTLLVTACGSDASSEADDAADEPTEQVDSGDAAAETTRLWIKPDLVECEGVAPQQCLQIATSADGPYEFFYDSIEGYEHEEGTSAVIDVTIEEIDEPPADASSLRYTLVDVVETDNDAEI